ncbi:MAG: hypothetical protein ACRC9V_13070, partial [Aeromonas sp.]
LRLITIMVNRPFRTTNMFSSLQNKRRLAQSIAFCFGVGKRSAAASKQPYDPSFFYFDLFFIGS